MLGLMTLVGEGIGIIEVCYTIYIGVDKSYHMLALKQQSSSSQFHRLIYFVHVINAVMSY